MVRQSAPFQKTKLALYLKLVETKPRPDAALIKMPAHPGRFCNEADSLSSDQGDLRVKLKMICLRLIALSTNVGTAAEQLTKQRSLKEAEQKATDVRYGLDSVKASLLPCEGRKICRQMHVHRISRVVGRLRDGNERV